MFCNLIKLMDIIVTTTKISLVWKIIQGIIISDHLLTEIKILYIETNVQLWVINSKPRYISLAILGLIGMKWLWKDFSLYITLKWIFKNMKQFHVSLHKIKITLYWKYISHKNCEYMSLCCLNKNVFS